MGLNVLSLFDGMSCGRLALERAGLDVEMYFSSEVDKYAIQVADDNYPVDKWTRLGDVRDIDASIFPEIDLLIGGSPCQSFSFAGKREGMATECSIEITTLEQYLQLRAENFEFKGQSYLFWEYMRILKEVKPKYFLLENVVMSKKWEAILTEAIGVEPIMINSALVSAQNRKRLYWTNIPNVTEPSDLGLVLNNILEDFDELNNLGLAQRGRGKNKGFIKDTNIKSPTLTKNSFEHNNHVLVEPVGAAMRGRYVVDGKRQDHKMKTAGLTTQRLELRDDGKTNALTTVQKDTLVALRPCEPRDYDESALCHHVANATDLKGNDQIKRVYGGGGKAPTVNTCQGGHREPKVLVNQSATKDGKAYCVTAIPSGAVAWNSGQKKQRTMVPTEESQAEEPNVYNGVKYRKLTPLECERLQTVPDNYTAAVSNSQRYKMLGNGWTVDVIAHIFKGLKNEL